MLSKLNPIFIEHNEIKNITGIFWNVSRMYIYLHSITVDLNFSISAISKEFSGKKCPTIYYKFYNYLNIF